MSTIVVGYDASPASRAAVDYAAARVAENGKLIVVHTYAVPPGFVGEPFAGERMGDAVAGAEERIEALRADCPALDGVDWEPDMLGGKPADAICRIAELRGAQEIVMGSRGTGRVRSLLGSVAQDVLHRATCPVVVIPARAVKPETEHAAAQEEAV